jgi:hypothetical protein
MLIGMTVSSSKGSRGKAPIVDGEADWRRKCCFLSPWHERPKCTCGHPCIIDVWEYDDIKWAGRCYFKCVDMEPDFMVWC